jgi:hypothetical protein
MIRLDFTESAYVTMALWASTDEHAEPLSDVYDAEHITDLPGFLEDLHNFLNEPEVAEILTRREIPLITAAQDFWLTRNHHGTGFWDRGLGEDGDALTKACDPYGEQTLMPADDGTLWWA